MRNLNRYRKQEIFGGWTRIDMLLAIYDKAIDSFLLARSFKDSVNQTDYTLHFIAGQKAVLAIHAGLKPDADEVAFNIARLLHFVLQCIERKDFDDAIKVLKDLRAGFAAIQKEASQLEMAGQIPPLQNDDSYVAMA